jgi:multicomponent Na+:H+ antiporter subunit D
MLLVLGLAGAFLAVVAGIAQRNPKTVLAYSTVSQMGLIAAGVGAGWMLPTIQPLLLPALLIYAVHHGLAKGALFLSVGLVPQLRSADRYRWMLWAMILFPALALVGLPLTSGMVAKAAYKSAVTDLDWLVTLLPFTAIGTSLLMARFIDLLRQSVNTRDDPSHGASGAGLLLPYAALILPVAGLIYFLPQSEGFLQSTVSPGAFWSASWPPLLGVALYLAFYRYLARIPSLPAGDVVVLFEAVAARAHGSAAYLGRSAAGGYGWLQQSIERSLAAVDSRRGQVPENWKTVLAIWSQPGFVFIAVLLAVVLAVFIAGSYTSNF